MPRLLHSMFVKWELYLFLGTSPSCRSGIWCGHPDSICHHWLAQGCYTPSWPVALHHHRFESKNQRGPTFPSGRPPDWKNKKEENVYLSLTGVGRWVSKAAELTLYFVTLCLSTQAPFKQKFLSPQLVPSAQGKCRVWHTSCPRALPVHQSLVQDCI